MEYTKEFMDQADGVVEGEQKKGDNAEGEGQQKEGEGQAKEAMK